MREIIFRAKRKDNGEWVYGDFVNDWSKHNTKPDKTICNNIGKYLVIPESVSEFTGLTDKNGTKIFEGDIVNFKTTIYHFKNCRVKYRSRYLRYCVINNQGDKYPMDKTFEYEVIGNIHDNPELIEKECEIEWQV